MPGVTCQDLGIATLPGIWCGRSARPVRRHGGPNPIGSPYPYQELFMGGSFKAMAGAGGSEKLVSLIEFFDPFRLR